MKTTISARIKPVNVYKLKNVADALHVSKSAVVGAILAQFLDKVTNPDGSIIESFKNEIAEKLGKG